MAVTTDMTVHGMGLDVTPMDCNVMDEIVVMGVVVQ